MSGDDRDGGDESGGGWRYLVVVVVHDWGRR